jgi:TonB family protein
MFRTAQAGAALLTCLLVTCCATAPPPTVPEPAVEPETATVVTAPETPGPAPRLTVRVTGSSLNVREGASTTTAAVAKVRKGDQLVVLADQGDWLQVGLPDSRVGWVNAKYVRREEPCLPDKLTAEILSGADEILRPTATLGRVVLDATVSAQGLVVSVKLVENSTGQAELAAQAETGLRAMRFAPPVRKCRPVPFVYTYVKTY